LGHVTAVETPAMGSGGSFARRDSRELLERQLDGLGIFLAALLTGKDRKK